MTHKYTGLRPLTLTYSVVDWQDQGVPPLLLNDQPLPPALTTTLPAVVGYNYPAGGVIIFVFAELYPADRAAIAAACTKPVTVTIPDNIKNGYVRGPGTATLVGLTLTVTLTQNVPVNFMGGTFGFW